MNPYEVELAQPSAIGSTRTGATVVLKSKQGAISWGDVAPLPGFSSESMSEVAAEWAENERIWTAGRVPLLDLTASQVARDFLAPYKTASLRFGIEQALLGMTAARHECHPVDLIAPGAGSIEVAGLVTSEERDVVDAAIRLVDSGYRTLKIKIGRRTISQDAALVHAVRRGIGDSVRIRLDTNRAWTLDQGLEFLVRMGGIDIEFLEEPLADRSQLQRLFDATGAPIALDETLLDLNADQLSDFSFVTHLVLKPTLLGGVLAAERFVETGRNYAMTPVISAAYESGLGISLLACLAARWCPDGPAAGLGTYRYLATDILPARLRFGPEIRLSETTFDLETS